MNRVLPWVSVATIAAMSFIAACSSDSDKKDEGSGGGTVAGGTGGSSAGTTSGGNGGSSAGNGGSSGSAGSGGSTAGTGGSGGSTSSPLGAACLSAADCGTGFTCITPQGTEWDGEGVGRGICTIECSADASVCGAGNVCLTLTEDGNTAYCVEGCTQGDVPFSGDDFFPDRHCHGRFEMACARLGEEPNTTDACVPTCTTDIDCGTGICNEATGTCATEEPAGLPIGSACNPEAIQGGEADPCAGFCIGISADSATEGFCTGLCTLGTFGLPGGCNSNPMMGAPQDGACVFGLSADGEIGDLGICANTCDCQDDCAPGLDCVELGAQTQTFTVKPGLCASANDCSDSTDPNCVPDVVLTECSGGTGGAGGTGGTGGSTGGTGGSTGGTGGSTGGTGGSTGGTGGSTGGTGGSTGGTGGASTGGTGGSTGGTGGSGN